MGTPAVVSHVFGLALWPAIRRRGAAALAALCSLGILAALVIGGLRRRRRPDIPVSPIRGGWHVGPDALDRQGLTTDAGADGLLENLGVLAREDFDPASVHPDVAAFYERTAAHRLYYRVRWHRPFRRGAALASRATGRIEQLNLPPPGDDRVHEAASRLEDVAGGEDPRSGVRGWIRRDRESGAGVFTALYATHRSRGETYVNIAVPLPGSNLTAVLTVDRFGTDAGGDGLVLTTRDRGIGGDEGLYLASPLGTLPVPLSQTFRVWPAGAPGAPEPVVDEADVVATHEMWLAGRQFLTIEYAVVLDGA